MCDSGSIGVGWNTKKIHEAVAGRVRGYSHITMDFRRQIYKFTFFCLGNRLSVFKDPNFDSLCLDLTVVRLVV